MSDDSNHCELGHELDQFALAELPPARMAEIRLHLQACAACRQELEGWQVLVAAADELRLANLAQVAPTEPALEAFWREIDRADGPGDVRADGAGERAASPRPVPLRRRPLPVAGVLLAAALFLTVVILPFTLPDDHGHLRPAEVSRPGTTVSLAPDALAPGADPRQVDVSGWSRFDLSSRSRETLVTDGALRARLAPGTSIEGDIDELTGARRVRVTDGAVSIANLGGAPVIVEAGGVESILDGHSSGVVTKEVSEDGVTTRTRFAVREGRATLRDASLGAPRIGPGAMEVGPGQGVALQSDQSGSPELVDIADLGGAPLPPPPPDGLALEPGDGLVGVDQSGTDPHGPVGTAVQSTGPSLPVGTVEIVLPSESFLVGDRLTVAVVTNAGNAGLGAYYLELDFQPRDSDLVVEIASPLATLIDGTAVSPLLQSFDAVTQVLRVADTNTRSLEPIGRGTFRLLSFDVRVLAASPGLHTVGGAVHQLLDVDARDIAPVQLQVRNSISIRRE